jgi:predicted nuclease with TOPRIM domain
MWGRTRIQQAAKELADHLGMIENIKALQTAQKELADAHRELRSEVRELQAELKVLKAELRHEISIETHATINAVQGGLHDRLQALAVKVALVEERRAETLSIDRKAADPSNQR